MVAALESNELLFMRAPRGVEKVRDEAHGRIDGIRAAEREIDVPQRCGCAFDELARELDGGRIAEMKIAGGIGQLAHLFGGCRDDALVAVADVDAPEPRERIEQFVAFGVAHECAACGFENGDTARFVRAIVDHGVNQMLTVGFDKRGDRHGGVLCEHERETLRYYRRAATRRCTKKTLEKRDARVLDRVCSIFCCGMRGPGRGVDQYPRLRSIWPIIGSPDQCRRRLSSTASTAVSGRVALAMCGVMRTRG